MRRAAILALVLAGCGAIERRHPEDWVRFTGGVYTMMVPPGLTESAVIASDLAQTLLTRPGLRLEVYEEKPPAGAPAFTKGLKVMPLNVCPSGRVETWTREAGAAVGDLIHASALLCEDRGIFVYAADPVDRDRAIFTYRSIGRRKDD